MNTLKILQAIKDRQDQKEWVSCYRDIEEATGLPLPIIKVEIKALRAQGMVHLVKAFDDEGKLCGSGYYITETGRRSMQPLTVIAP